jgi:two-component system, OmpR family, sensor histidine kinase TctE
MSLAARLLEWLLAPLLFLWLLSLGLTFLAARETVDTALDEQLNLAASLIFEEWRDRATPSVSPTLAFPSPSVRRILLSDAAYPIRYLIVGERDQILAGDEGMIALLRSEAGELRSFRPTDRIAATGFNSVLDEDFVRVIRLRVDVNGEQQSLVVAQPREHQNRLLRAIIFYEAIPQSFVLFIAVFLVWYGLAYVVRPMRTLKTHLDARGGDDLTPLPQQLAPPELAPLIESINALMARLKAAQGAQRRFIANAAHQLRTPLAAMRANCELLAQAIDPRRREHVLEQLLATSSRASRLANQLLSLARAESSATTARFADIEINGLCRDVAREVLPMALERNIEFGFEGVDDPVIVCGDATLLSELIHNLIDNALKYTPRHGTVLLSILAHPPQILIEDSGPGISEEDRERVFAPFTRIARFEAGSAHAIGGTGLGLAIVKEVAQSHRAKVEISSSRFGGAMFRVTFPTQARLS